MLNPNTWVPRDHLHSNNAQRWTRRERTSSNCYSHHQLSIFPGNSVADIMGELRWSLVILNSNGRFMASQSRVTPRPSTMKS